MKNKKDYIYEYSDLNKFQTRVKILTGDYAEVILEFGSSYVTRIAGKKGGQFTFTYTLYAVPENLATLNLREDEPFQRYISTLLQSIIRDRKKDRKEKYKLMQAASNMGVVDSIIKIDDKFYIKGLK